MLNFKRILLTLASCSVALPGLTEQESSAPNWLFAQTASEFISDGETFTIPFEREVFAFTDRPNRLYRYLNATEFASLWGIGYNDFTENPPNAVLTWIEDGVVNEAELEIKSVAVNQFGRSLTYGMIFLSGDAVPMAAQNISIFFDDQALADIECSTFMLNSNQWNACENSFSNGSDSSVAEND
ncbi:hypothetical protein MWN63_15590 [Paradonghicola geojensis]|nr:hypothetical protein [Marivivens geojensis]